MLKTEIGGYMIINNVHWIVYCHINKINNKMYIGITSKKNPQERWRYGNGYADTPHFGAAIQKYGWDNFEHEIIASNLTEDEACNFERLLIKELNLLDDRYGYNISEGGNRGCRFKGERAPMYGKHHTEESKQKNREKHLGKTFNLSEEAKEKIHKAMLGNNNGFKTKVCCVETGIIYESAAEAGRQTNTDSSAIIKCTKGKLHKTNNFHWISV